MPEIKIRVGAAADASLRTVFRPLVEAATAARKHIMVQLGAIPRDLGIAFGQGSKQAAGAMKGIETSAKLIGRTVSAEARAAAKEQAAAARRAAAEARAASRSEAAAARQAAREKVAAARQAAREQIALERDVAQQTNYYARAALSSKRQAYREEQSAARRAAREAAMAARQQSRELDRFVTRTSHRATRFFMPNMPIASMARRGASEVARGIGVDPTISGAFQRNVQLESSAVAAVNQARLAGDESTTAEQYAAKVREVSSKRGFSREETGGALEAFQKKTGDLRGGMALLDRFAERAGATATKLDEYADAMGDVWLALGDAPNKSQRVLEVMDAITIQGARGAVEVRDLATHMARLASVAPRFEGEVGQNVIKMGALAQLARAKGGAPSAAEAARSVVGFANTMKKGARIDKFEAAGVNVFADEGKTTFKDPIRLIKESLNATKGNLHEMNKLFMDVVGERAVGGLTTAYNRAGGGDAGMKAVDKELAVFLQAATLTQQKLDQMNASRDKTTEVKVTKFQNKMDDIAQKAGERLLPALEKLEPTILKIVEGFGKLATWTAENPWKAFGAAITLALGRAGLESAARLGVERLLTAIAALITKYSARAAVAPAGGGVATPGGPGGKGGGGKLAVGVGTGVQAVIGAYAGYQAGEAIGDAVAGKGGAETGRRVGMGAGAGLALGPAGALLGASMGLLYDAIDELYTVTDGFKTDEERNAKAKKEAREREKAKAKPEEFAPERRVYQARPGESAESLRKRIEANPNDPELTVLSRTALPADQTWNKNRKLGSVAGAFKWRERAPGEDPMAYALSRAGLSSPEGSSGKSGGKDPGVEIVQLLTRVDESINKMNRSVDALSTKTLTVRDVTPKFSGFDESNTVGPNGGKGT